VDAAQLAEVSATIASAFEVEAMKPQRPQSPTEDQQAAEDAWLDDALAQSFPASDPVSHFRRDPPAVDLDDPLPPA
jgi:hypothetical protein